MKNLLRRREEENKNTDLFGSFKDQMDRLFGDFFGEYDSHALLKTDFTPRVNLSEDEKAFHLEAEIPGAKKEDINVEFKENRLFLKGERKEEKEKKDKKSYLKESSYGFFERSFSFPENIDVKSVKAAFKDGVLKLEIPKTETKESIKKIEVK